MDTVTCTWAKSSKVSDVAVVGGRTICAIQFPAEMTSTTITITGHPSSIDSTTFASVYKDDSTQFSLTVPTNAARIYCIPPAVLAGLHAFQLNGDSTEGAARSVTIGCREVK